MSPLESLLMAFEAVMSAFVDGTSRIGAGPMLAFVILLLGFRAFGQMAAANAQRRKDEVTLLKEIFETGKEERDAERLERAHERAANEREARLEALLEALVIEIQKLQILLTNHLSLTNGDTK